MAPLNKKDSTEKQINQIAKQLKTNGTIISEMAESLKKKMEQKAPLTITPSINLN